MNRNVEIFKETRGSNMLYAGEVNEILKVTRSEFKYNDDRANNIVAFALGGKVSREDADNLVDRLNGVLDKEGEMQESWFLGDEDEEYVFVN